MIGTKIYKNDMSEYTECAIWCNKNNATTVDRGGYYEVVEIEPYIPTKEEQINKLKAELSSTDYEAIKYSEGWFTDKEYAPIKAMRESLREQIRALESDTAQ